MTGATRRRLLQSGLALSTAASTAALAAPFDMQTEDAAPPALRLERLVFDDRYPQARELARKASERGLAATAFSGDLTDLWRDDLRPTWRAAPAPLAGVTTHRGLFVLEVLASDHRMSVVYRSDLAATRLDAPREEALVSWIIAPRPAAAARV